MANPKKRTTRAKRGMRRSHHALKKMHLSKCSNCGSAVLPHTICENCGQYDGRQIRTMKTKKRKTDDHAGHDHAHDHKDAITPDDKK